ncbi:MAG: flagellar biosynthetic protein FliO [Spirochaetota bacterium]
MKKLTRFLYAVVFCMVAFSGLGAQEAEPAAGRPQLLIDESTLVLAEAPDEEIQAPATSLFPYVLRMIIVLAFVIAAIYGLYALMRRAARPRNEEDAYIKVLASSPLAAGKTLHVVAVGERAWLLASADAAVSVVSEIEDRELIDALTLRAAASPGAPREDFVASLRRLLTKGSRTGGTVSGSVDFLVRQRDRLKKM